MNKIILLLLIGFGYCAGSYAQTNTIIGNAAPSVTTTYNYTLTSSSMVTNPVWQVSGGITPYVYQSADNLNFKCSINWTTSGTFTITFKNGSTTVDTHTVVVTCTPPSPSLISSLPVVGKGKITMVAELPGIYNGNYNFHWYNAASGGTMVGTGSVFVTPVLTATTQYWVATFEPASLCESARVQVTAQVNAILSANQTVEEIVRVKGVKTDADLLALTEATQRRTIKTHYDGLMRMTQQVAVKATPGGLNLVQPIEYDSVGRVSKQYLPYATPNIDGGEFQSFYETNQANFYNTPTDNIADDTKPYAVTIYEQSPMGRVLKSGSVGNGFQPDQGHASRFEYVLNNASEVRQFNSDGSSTGYWAADKLYKVKSINAEGHHVLTFTNPSGQTVLQRQQLDETIDGVMVNYLDTYYIYDDPGQLKYILSPKGVKALAANSWVLSTAILDNYAHRFVYDNRGRVVEKKVPGQAWTYLVYDDLNRLVLTQDGLLRAQNKWMFIKYDFKGRAVLSGLYLNATQTTRSAVQTLADGLYTASNPAYGVNAWYETRGTALHGYSNTSFPKTNADNSALEMLSANYYDDHDFDYNGTADYTYTVQSLTNENTPGRTRGLPTGSKRLVLGTTTWLYTYIFYDEYGRAIQMRSNNHLNPSVIDNLSTSVYLFDGTLTTTKTYHNPGSSAVTVINKFAYDDQGRLKEVKQSNNGSADQVVAAYTYNELGQLVDKKLHNTSGSNYLQSVDYRYTIRGQLKSINNAQLSNDGQTSNDDPDSDRGDYFGMELLYNQTESGLTTTGLFDGNISAIKWKGMGTDAGATGQKSYKFAYDKTGKLETATWQVKGASAWDKETGAHNETMTYDHDGNIKTLQRSQRKHQLTGVVASYISEVMDNLTYTYNTTNGNSLEKVTDAALTAGFNNGTSGTGNDFTYDTNGNLTADANKGISNIVYNFLGKPTQITFSSGKVINYTYDAAGSKLKMSTTEAGVTTTTDYAGSFVYINNTLKFFGSPEGRVVKNGSAFEYEYAIADHHGNTRVVFTSATPAPVAPTATFEGDANDKANEYINGTLNIVSFGNANHTPGGSKVVRMNQSNKIGPAKSVKVFPGDKIDLEVWEYHEGASGFGTTGSPLTTLITSVAGAFGGVSGAGGESGMIYTGVNSAVTAFGTGGNQGDARPAAYLNFILFDKNYKVLDAGWQLAPATTFTKQKLSFPTKDIKEEGYLYTWLSYDDASNNYVYFDDFKVTHTKSNVIQYNEYYPFGLQTSNSWTRENSSNNFLYNGGSEMNASSGWYETFFRGYDPTLGRFMQVDPMATSEMATYQYAGNNPVLFNDPYGAAKADPTGVYGSVQRLRDNDEKYRLQWHHSVFSTDLGGPVEGGYRYSGSSSLLTIDIDRLADGAHSFDFSNGQLSNYTYYSDADISGMGMSLFSSIIGSNYNPNSDYTGGPRLWGDAAGTVFSTTGERVTVVTGRRSPVHDAPDSWVPVYGDIQRVIYWAGHDDWSRVGLYSMSAVTDVLGFGALGKAAVKTGARVFAKNGTKYLYHYTSREAAESIAKVGLRKPEKGFVYTTTNGNLTPIQAQIELALSPNRGLPTSLLQIDAGALGRMGITPVLGPRSVSGGTFGAGGGIEVLFNQPIPPSVITKIR